MPTVVLEAMSCGVPVVVTDVGAVSELVDDGRTGLIVRTHTPEAIAAAIERLLDEPGLREETGTAARGRALERFDLQTLADLHLAAYEHARAHCAARAA
jgi:glycosyltransferase involved in cell wall biosynthesis